MDHVGAGAAVMGIEVAFAGFPVDGVVARIAINGIGAATAAQRVVADPAIDGVAAGAAGDAVVAVAHEDDLEPGVEFPDEVRQAGAHVEGVVGVVGPVVDGVDVVAALHRLVAQPRQHGVVAGVAVIEPAVAVRHDPVVARPAIQRVDAVPAGQRVIAVAAVDGVGPAPAIDGVVAAIGGDPVAARRPDDGFGHRVEIAHHVDRVGVGGADVPVLEGPARQVDRRRGAGAHVDIEPVIRAAGVVAIHQQAGEGIGMCPGDVDRLVDVAAFAGELDLLDREDRGVAQVVGARPAHLQRVGAIVADIALVREGPVADAQADQVVAGLAVQQVGAGAAFQQVGAAATFQRVTVCTAIERIVVVIAVQRIRPRLAIEDVGAGPAMQRVGPRAGIDRVVAGVAGQFVGGGVAVDQFRPGATDGILDHRARRDGQVAVQPRHVRERGRDVRPRGDAQVDLGVVGKSAQVQRVDAAAIGDGHRGRPQQRRHLGIGVVQQVLDRRRVRGAPAVVEAPGGVSGGRAVIDAEALRVVDAVQRQPVHRLRTDEVDVAGRVLAGRGVVRLCPVGHHGELFGVVRPGGIVVGGAARPGVVQPLVAQPQRVPDLVQRSLEIIVADVADTRPVLPDVDPGIGDRAVRRPIEVGEGAVHILVAEGQVDIGCGGAGDLDEVDAQDILVDIQRIADRIAAGGGIRPLDPVGVIPGIVQVEPDHAALGVVARCGQVEEGRGHIRPAAPEIIPEIVAAAAGVAFVQIGGQRVHRARRPRGADIAAAAARAGFGGVGRPDAAHRARAGAALGAGVAHAVFGQRDGNAARPAGQRGIADQRAAVRPEAHIRRRHAAQAERDQLQPGRVAVIGGGAGFGGRIQQDGFAFGQQAGGFVQRQGRGGFGGDKRAFHGIGRRQRRRKHGHDQIPCL